MGVAESTQHVLQSLVGGEFLQKMGPRKISLLLPSLAKVSSKWFAGFHASTVHWGKGIFTKRAPSDIAGGQCESPGYSTTPCWRYLWIGQHLCNYGWFGFHTTHRCAHLVSCLCFFGLGIDKLVDSTVFFFSFFDGMLNRFFWTW